MEHSAQFEILKKRWEEGSISEQLLRGYVKTGRITSGEFEEITGLKY